MKIMRHMVCLLIVAWLTSSSAWAFASSWQDWRGSRGWGMNAPYQKLYNATDVIIVSGDVLSVEKQAPMKGMCFGIFLTVKTRNETLSVHLGPLWYIERLDYKISPGDKVEIKGARLSFNHRPAIIAAEIRRGNKVLILRDHAGIPVWVGWGWKR